MRGRTMIILLVVGSLVLVELLGLGKLYYNYYSYARYWTNVNNTARPSNSILYVALGDSAAQGLGASRPEKGYVGLVANELARKSDKPVHVVNLSRSGARIKDVIDAQLPKLKQLPITNETVITIEIGGNDIISFNKAQFEKTMDQLLSRLPSQTIVANMPYFGGGRYWRVEHDAAAANEIIGNLTKKYGLRMASLHETTKQKNSIFVNAPDLFHPNNRGYRNWFEAFRTQL